MIKAQIIADSISPYNARLTTFILTYPRFIHSEFMTHRVFSRNASSSRAIPVSKFMDAIKTEPAMPISFTKNCKGMQAKEEIEEQELAEKIWLEARDAMIQYTTKLSDLGVHKQHANRLLEPFQHMNVVASATDLSNFFALRTHKDAQPEFRALANLMWEAYVNSQPVEVSVGDWHLPFITPQERVENFRGRLSTENMIKMSVARCARVSYNTLDGTENTLEKDLQLYEKLVGNSPIHASPAEHQAKAASSNDVRSGNFTGWNQYRKTLNNENILSFPGLAKSE